MIYVFDIDGTICTFTDGDYKMARPIRKRIEEINYLFEEGHTIIFHTARGMGRTKNDIIQSYVRFYDLTFNQLKNWKVKFHHLFLGKPAGDMYIDDKGVQDDAFFTY